MIIHHDFPISTISIKSSILDHDNPIYLVSQLGSLLLSHNLIGCVKKPLHTRHSLLVFEIPKHTSRVIDKCLYKPNCLSCLTFFTPVQHY
jgi:hypothetical protein